MQTVDVDVAPEGTPPVRLRVRRWVPTGPSGGAPFMLVHGLSSNARLWDEVAAILCGAGHEVCALDLRSHGESDAPSAGHDTATAADDVAAACAGLGLDRVLAVGQSWGGNVVVRLAARHPDLVAGLALVDGGWIDLSASFSSWSECAAALRPPDVDGRRAEDIRRLIAGEHPDWSAQAVEATLANLRALPDGTVQRRLRIDHHMQILRSMWDEPPWRDFPHITAPVLLLPAVDAAGADDKRALVTKAASMLADSAVREYVGGDHDLHAQQPAAVAADLLSLAARALGEHHREGGGDGRPAGRDGLG
jgi:pimeloyl-ACP methyl ester carboxylesterase